jgi:hypothetical protein
VIQSALADWSQAESGSYRWWVAPALTALGFGEPKAALDRALEDGRAKAVKQGPHRIVYRVEVSPGQSIYVKHNLLPDTRAWLRQLIRPSKARMEMDRALQIAVRGVPTVEPLALGERQAAGGAGDSYLITRGLEDTVPLNSFLATQLATMSEPRGSSVRQRLAVALGRFIAKMHGSGIRHDDLHAANVLVRLDGADELLLFLIDLNAVHLGEALDWATARQNLIIFTRWFVPRASRPDRLRFWRSYYTAAGIGTWPSRHGADREPFAIGADLEKRAWRSALAFWQNRDGRAVLNNRYYRKVRGPGTRGHVVAELDPSFLRSLLADPDFPFQQPQTRFIKKSRGSIVAEIDVDHGGRTRRLIYKRFNVTHWARPWYSLVRSTAALRSWVLGHGFRERCLPTARPWAVLHRAGSGPAREGYLLAEKIENAVDLHGFLAHLPGLPTALARLRLRLGLEALARQLRYLHQCRLDHRDLKASNMLILRDLEHHTYPFAPMDAETAGAAVPSLLPLPASPLWFIDLVGVTRHTTLSRSRRIQNLMRLNASFHQSRCLTRSDKLRFLRSYLLWNLQGSAGWKVWWRAIEGATASKVVANARRGRVLA